MAADKKDTPKSLKKTAPKPLKSKKLKAIKARSKPALAVKKAPMIKNATKPNPCPQVPILRRLLTCVKSSASWAPWWKNMTTFARPCKFFNS